MTVTETPKLFHYRCEYYSETEDEITVEEGITAGLTYSAAAHYVEEAYQTNNIINLELYETFLVLNYDDIKEDFEK